MYSCTRHTIINILSSLLFPLVSRYSLPLYCMDGVSTGCGESCTIWRERITITTSVHVHNYIQSKPGLYARDDCQFIYWGPCDVPNAPVHPDISESKTSEVKSMIFMMMADTLDNNNTINVHELLSAITEISNPIPPPGAVKTYNPLEHGLECRRVN
jgi:hypothetical protein